MTDTTMTLRPRRRLLQRFWLSLTLARRSTPTAHPDTWSDHMLRDIGVTRGPIDQMASQCLHDAMRYWD
ncbi:hypothetical protein [Rhizobium herbae]